MRYRLQESSFELPDGLHDQSVNIFTSSTSGPSGFSIVITRGTVDLGSDLAEHVSQELQALQRTLVDFRLTYRRQHQVDGRMVEIAGATFSTGDVVVEQHQVFLVDGPRSLTITASAAGAVSPEQFATFRDVVQSFRFGS